MGIPELDRRGKEELLRTLAASAAAYTPEWRFDLENPDLGATLSLIYTELFAQTLKRFNQVPEKNMAAFFSSVDAKLLPALPAEGFVRFALAGQVEAGAEVRAGTPLLADAEDEETGATTFETTDDVFVTPAEPEQIFTVCGGADAIVRGYDRRTAVGEPFYLFDLKGENLQRHALYLAQETVLELSAGARLELLLTPSHQRELPRAVGEALTDPARAVWEYSYGNSWQTFSGCTLEGNRILLELGARKLPVTPAVQEGLPEKRWLRLRLAAGTRLPPFSLRQLRLSAQNRELLPDLVHASGTDQDLHSFFPFGEQLGLFAEVYLGCGEALVKRGAEIEMTFHLDFVPVPVDYAPGETPINWKLVMKKKDFRLDEEFDITIQEVLWEYFNGNGWARLYPDSRESDCFTASLGAVGQRKTLRFRCPEDIQPVLVNAGVGYCIRARILKIKNLYKLKGNYIVPLIEGLRFSYHYPQRGRLPELVAAENNRELQTWDGAFFRNGDSVFTPFSFLEEEKAALYFGFPLPPVGGPVKLLFLLAEALREQPGRLRWEYRGSHGWESLNVVDETENLRQTGILILMGGADFRRVRLWGEELYWIRALDEEGRYWGRGGKTQLPRVTGLYMNATRVRNVATQRPERFALAPQEKNFTCKLLRGRVYRAQVWVNEMETLLPAQIAALEKGDSFRPVRDAAGILQEAWVRWEEREDFALSHPDDRHYLLDRNEGTVRFSDGLSGRIPPSGKQETIEILSVTGGGLAGNVAAGAINRSSRALGFVSTVENPRPTAGGCEQETFEQAIHRGGAALRHGDRAVTGRDFESLALEATRNIVRARCFPNRDDGGQRRPGWVTLVVVLRDYAAGADFFPAVQAQVLDYITCRCGGNLAALEHFHVVQPQFLELCVKVELTVGSFNQVFPVREEIGRRLEVFLNPMTGNFDGKGWAVGQIPNDTQLRNCLSGVRGISFLKHVSATAFLETGFGRAEVNLEDLQDKIFALPRSGRHEIRITVE
ncbi:MAG: baseplate J/gp47 family protein [Oscillospiraceae bacterium]